MFLTFGVVRKEETKNKQQKEEKNCGYNVWDFLMIYEIFLWPQVKQSLIIGEQNIKNEFSHVVFINMLTRLTVDILKLCW